MQVKIKQEPKVFKPVTLEITFETAEELLLMQEMLVRYISVPELVFHDDDVSVRKLSDIMTELHTAITDVI